MEAQFTAPAESIVDAPQPPGTTSIIGYSLLCEVIAQWGKLTKIEDCKAVLILTRFLAKI